MFESDETIKTLIWQATNNAERLRLPVAIVNRDDGLILVNLEETVHDDIILEVIRPSSCRLKTASKTLTDIP